MKCADRSVLLCTQGGKEKEYSSYWASFWQHRYDLLIAEGLLIKEKRLVIPGSIQEQVLEKIHQEHQGILQCLARAHMSVWWPGITKQIKAKVSQCKTCQKQLQSPRPLLTTPLPSWPWQRVAADLFHWNKGNYVLLIDYYSCYVEVASLTSTTTAPVIERCLSDVCSSWGPRDFSYGQWAIIFCPFLTNITTVRATLWTAH